MIGACCCCGSNSLSMSTVNVNPSSDQSVCCCSGDGGASTLSSSLNAIGRWGTALTGVLQGKPVATNKSGVAVGAKGSTSIGGIGNLSGNAMLLILAIIGILIFMTVRK